MASDGGVGCLHSADVVDEQREQRGLAGAQLANEEEDIASLSDGSELSSEALGVLNVLEVEL